MADDMTKVRKLTVKQERFASEYATRPPGRHLRLGLRARDAAHRRAGRRRTRLPPAMTDNGLDFTKGLIWGMILTLAALWPGVADGAEEPTPAPVIALEGEARGEPGG